MHGASIFSKIWGGIKSAYKLAKDSGLLPKAVDAAVPALATYAGQPTAAIPAKAAINSLTGIGVNTYDSDYDHEGGRISMDDIKQGAKRALGYAKRKGIITDLVDLGERKLIDKATKPEHVDMIKYVRRGIKNRYGVGIKSNKSTRFVKGSQEAKDHMAKIRAMRKSGGSFKL